MNIFQNISQTPQILLFVILIWSIIWKGMALWKSAKLNQRNWFVAILVLNTFGLLEIAYLFFFANKKMRLEELKFWETK